MPRRVHREGVGFGTDTNEVSLINDTTHDIIYIPLSSKQVIADKLLNIILLMNNVRR